MALVAKYPLLEINAQEWKHKVSMTAMYTIPSEEEALPILKELDEIFDRLVIYDIGETLGPQVVPFFFDQVFQPVCHKIIRSRYFKKLQLYAITEHILYNCALIAVKYLEKGSEHPNFNQILSTILASDEYFFRCNTQIDTINPWQYYSSLQTFTLEQRNSLQIQDLIDVLDIDEISSKVLWSPAKIIEIQQHNVRVQYLYKSVADEIILPKNSDRISEYQSMAHRFSWRLSACIGDKVEIFNQNSKTWTHAQIVMIEKSQNVINFKLLTDESMQEIMISAASPKVQPYNTIVLQGETESEARKQYINDQQFVYFNGQRIYALPRKKFQSGVLIKIINQIGKICGFQKLLDYLDKQNSLIIFASLVKTFSQISNYLHNQVRKNILQRLKFFFLMNETLALKLQKSQLQTIFSNLHIICKYIQSEDSIVFFKNSLLIRSINIKLRSKNISQQQEGIQHIKAILTKNKIISAESSKLIKNWALDQNIFELVYIDCNSCTVVQKSQELFNFMLRQQIITPKQIIQFYQSCSNKKMAKVKYCIIENSADSLKYDQMLQIVDAILAQQILTQQNITLLFSLSQNKSIFPYQKVILFFKKALLNQKTEPELLQVLYHRLSELLLEQKVGNYIQLFNNLFSDECYKNRKSLNTGTRVLKLSSIILKKIKAKNYMEGDEQTKKQINKVSLQSINQLISQTCLCKVISNLIIQATNSKQNQQIITDVLKSLLEIFRVSRAYRIFTVTFTNIFCCIKNNTQYLSLFIECLRQFLSDKQATSYMQDIGALKDMFKQIMESIKDSAIKLQHFYVIQYLFEGINNKIGLLIKADDKLCRVTNITEMFGFDYLMDIIHQNKFQSIIEPCYSFVNSIYNNTLTDDYDQVYMNKLLSILESLVQRSSFKSVDIVLKLLDNLLCEAEKNNETHIKSYSSQIQCPRQTINVKNQLSYGIQTMRTISFELKSNSSFADLKKLLASKLNVSVDKIAVRRNGELIDNYHNARQLKQLQINSQSTIKIQKALIPTTSNRSMSPQNLIVGEQLNSKAVIILKKLFQKYSEQGRMTKEHFKVFVQVCLNIISPVDHKVDKFFEETDKDNLGYIHYAQFLKFYSQSAKTRPSTVICNFMAHGAFGYYSMPGDCQKNTIMPRQYISQSKKLSDLLVQLLNQSQCQVSSYKLLGRLEINNIMVQQIKNSAKLANIDNILSEINSAYKKIYYLETIDYMFRSQLQEHVQWKIMFIQNRGQNFIFKYVISAFSSDKLEEIEIKTATVGYKVWENITLSSINKQQSAIMQLSQQIFSHTFTFQQKLQLISLNSKNIANFSFTLSHYEQSLLSTSINYLIKRLLQDKYQKNSVLVNSCLKIINLFLLNNLNQQLHRQFLSILLAVKESKLHQKILLSVLYQCSAKRPELSKIYFIHMLQNIGVSPTNQKYKTFKQILSKFDQSQKQNYDLEFVEKKVLEDILKSNNQQLIISGIHLLSSLKLDSISVKDTTMMLQTIMKSKEMQFKENIKSAYFTLLNAICNRNMKLRQTTVQYFRDILFAKLPLIENMNGGVHIDTAQTGLKNLGNTGYINSILQVLFTNKKLRRYIQQKKIDQSCGQLEIEFLKQLQKISVYLKQSSRTEISPQRLISLISQRINNAHQPQDAHEFLMHISDFLDSFLSQKQSMGIFWGQIKYTLQCQNCAIQTSGIKKFNSIQLSTKQKDLQHSLEKYFTPQQIEDLYCTKCQQKYKGLLAQSIQKYPEIMPIHLKRAYFNYETLASEKNHSLFPFPSHLKVNKLSNTQEQQNGQKISYQLVGIISHQGNISEGHYLAYTKKTNENWLKHDDSIVTQLNYSQVQQNCFGHAESEAGRNYSQTATVLLYQKIINDNKNSTTIYKLIQQQLSTSLSIYQKQIQQDNLLYHLQVMVNSNSFSKFLIELMNNLEIVDDQILSICNMLTFTHWKSMPIYLDMLKILKKFYRNIGNINSLTENTSVIQIMVHPNNLLIKKSTSQFLSETISFALNQSQLQQNTHKIYAFLKKIFDKTTALKQTTVNKTISAEYYQFWATLGQQSNKAIEFMQHNNFIHQFMEYFIQKSSGINKQQFSPFVNRPKLKEVLECIMTIASYNNKSDINNKQINLIAQNLDAVLNQNLSDINRQVIEVFCPHNIQFSKKVAKFLIKLISQRKITILAGLIPNIISFVLIDDEFTQIRMQWIFGKQTCALFPSQQSSCSYQMVHLGTRTNYYRSSLSEQDSILEQMYHLRYSMPEYVLVCLQTVMQICNKSQIIRQLMLKLGSPCIQFSSCRQMWCEFLDKYPDLPTIKNNNQNIDICRIKAIKIDIQKLTDMQLDNSVYIPVSYTLNSCFQFPVQSPSGVQANIGQYYLKVVAISINKIRQFFRNNCMPLQLSQLLEQLAEYIISKQQLKRYAKINLVGENSNRIQLQLSGQISQKQFLANYIHEQINLDTKQTKYIQIQSMQSLEQPKQHSIINNFSVLCVNDKSR